MLYVSFSFCETTKPDQEKDEAPEEWAAQRDCARLLGSLQTSAGQEPRKWSFSKGGFCGIRCHLQETENSQGYWAEKYIRHSERHSLEKRLVAPYRAILRYYRCDTTYRAILLLGGQQLPKMVRYPPLVLSSTQAHLCDTPFCNISRDKCAIPHKNKHERVLRYYRYRYRAI